MDDEPHDDLLLFNTMKTHEFQYMMIVKPYGNYIEKISLIILWPIFN